VRRPGGFFEALAKKNVSKDHFREVTPILKTITACSAKPGASFETIIRMIPQDERLLPKNP
jgi:hypothetical protein